MNEVINLGDQSLTKESNSVRPTEIVNKHFRNIALLLESGALVSRPKKDEWDMGRDYLVDQDKAVACLEIPEDIDEQNEEQAPKNKEWLEQETDHAYQEIIADFIDEEVLTEELAGDIRKLIPPSNIEVTDDNFFRFLYDADKVPDSEDKAAKLVVGLKMQKYLERRLRKILNNTSVSLDDEVVSKIAIRWGMSHELGHSVERSIMIRNTEKMSADNPDLEVWQAAIRVHNKVNNKVYLQLAPDSNLQKIFEDEDGIFMNSGNSTGERVASGYEMIGLRSALAKSGVETTVIDEIIANFASENLKMLEEGLIIESLANQKGLSLGSLCSALTDIRLGIKDKNPDVYDQLPLTFGSNFFGYLAPLSKDQLRAFINLEVDTK